MKESICHFKLKSFVYLNLNQFDSFGTFLIVETSLVCSNNFCKNSRNALILNGDVTKCQTIMHSDYKCLQKQGHKATTFGHLNKSCHLDLHCFFFGGGGGGGGGFTSVAIFNSHACLT